MKIGKAFTYAFEDRDWLGKLLLAAVFAAIPIVNFLYAGYLVNLVRNVTNREAEPLPDWDKFGEKFIKGLVIGVAGLIYGLPALILSLIIVSAWFIPVFGGSEDVQTTLVAITSGLGLVLACFIVIYLLVYSFIYPAIVLHYSREESFGSCFQIGRIFGIITRNMGNYLTAWLISIVFLIVFSFLMSIVTVVLNIIPCVGWIISLFVSLIGGVYLFTVFAYLFGQVVAMEGPAAA